MVKNPPAVVGSIPGSGRSLKKEMVTYSSPSYLGDSMDRGDWQAIVYGVTKSQT